MSGLRWGWNRWITGFRRQGQIDNEYDGDVVGTNKPGATSGTTRRVGAECRAARGERTEDPIGRLDHVTGCTPGAG